MLDGMTLLYEYEVVIGAAAAIGAWIATIVFALLTLYGWLRTGKYMTATNAIMCIVATIVTVVGFITACTIELDRETRYKVTIDHSVSYREFTSYYEVIEVEGEIYTIRESAPIDADDSAEG